MTPKKPKRDQFVYVDFEQSPGEWRNYKAYPNTFSGNRAAKKDVAMLAKDGFPSATRIWGDRRRA